MQKNRTRVVPFHSVNSSTDSNNRQPFDKSSKFNNQNGFVDTTGRMDQKIKPTLTCVTFQRDTDGRSNFPTQRDFQDFCKQRDLFYSIKELWTLRKSNHLIPSQPQDYDPAFGKMRALFQLNSNPTNLIKLSSLFLSQCVLDSIYSNQVETTFAENNVRKILQSNPSKLQQLRERVAPPNATADFIQISDPISFLKYFLNSSNVPSCFSRHLMDMAVHEILEGEKSVDEDNFDEKELLDLMKKSRLLAKLLGYIYFSPYYYTNGTDIQIQASLRSYQTLPINLYSILQKSLSKNRLVFTLPWILEFLSKADPAVFYISTYKPILSLISSIYSEMNNLNITPSNVTFLSNYCDIVPQCKQFKKIQLELNNIKKNNSSDEIPIDCKDFIGTKFNNDPVYFKKRITSSTNVDLQQQQLQPTSPFPDLINPIQSELEIHFFQIHPPSIKRTVEFISERIASNFVKKLRNVILIDLKKYYREKLIYGNDAVIKCKLEILKQQNEYCPIKCEAIMLLIDIEEIHNICYDICKRKSDEKINEWVLQHVTEGLFPQPTIKLESTAAAIEPKREQQNNTGDSFEIIKFLHECTLKLYNREVLNTNDINKILNESSSSSSSSSFLLTQKNWIKNTLITFVFELAAFQPDLLTDEIQYKFISLWCKLHEIGKILNPRNLMILSKNGTDESWNVIGYILKKIFIYKLMDINEQDEFYLDKDNEWDSNIFKNILKLKHFVFDDKGMNE